MDRPPDFVSPVPTRLRTAIGERGWPHVHAQYQWLLARNGGRFIHLPEAIRQDAAPAMAYVNSGRWVADCPNPRCTGDCRGAACSAAMDLLPDRDAPYMCGCCYNADIDGEWRPVEWPDNQHIRHAERLLAARWNEHTRNWHPHQGETAVHLASENDSHLPQPGESSEESR